MQHHTIIEEKYSDFVLSHLEQLGLYRAFQSREKEYLINKDGDIVYKLPESSPSEFYSTNFSSGKWHKLDTELNLRINYWIEIKYTSSESLPMTATVFTFKNNQVVQLLREELLLNAIVLSPERLLLQIAADKSAPFSLSRICIYDIKKNEFIAIHQAKYRQEPFLVHSVFGSDYLFSVLIKEVRNKAQDYDHQLFWLYNHEGERLVNFETTIGQNGEITWFEPSKRGLGIAYKILDRPFKIASSSYDSNYSVCNVLIDRHGHDYGDFYHIAGQTPGYIGKSSTRQPKYLDKKLLCLSLPEEETSHPHLSIFDENNNLIRTKYEYPWIFAYSSNSLIKDKNIFGKTCITVIDHNNYVRLIDLEGNEIAHTIPIKFHSLTVNYAKMFTLQAIEIAKRYED